MVVLSLFDGISCGYLALKRLKEHYNENYPSIDKYFASEIESTAIKIATTNNSDIIEIGDVTKVFYDKNTGYLQTENGSFYAGHIDLMIGGSPCTDFSTIGSQNGMSFEDIIILTLDDYLRYKTEGYKFKGESYLFWEYLRLLYEIQPTYFLLENVLMSSKWRSVIDMSLGENPIEIDSALVSAQTRKRQYWTNIPNVSVPTDKHISLDDILDVNADIKDCSQGIVVQKNMPKLVDKYGKIPLKFNAYNATEVLDKACTLTKGSMVSSSCATLLWVKTSNGVHTVKDGILDNEYPIELEDGQYNLRKLNLLEMERLQTLPDNYTAVDGVGANSRSSCIGNGWTVDVIVHLLRNVRVKG